MAWSGGSFTRTNGTHSGATAWAQDEAALVGIESGRHDTHDQDLAAGINACLNKDGSNSPTAAMNFDSQRLTNLGSATARNNAINLGQVQDQAGVWGGTSAGTANAQTITCSVSPGSYVTGQRFAFKAGNANTSTVTLNVNALGAVTIYKDVNGLRAALGSGDLIANGIYEVIYDSAGGGQFVLQTSKPGVASFTHSLAPASGVFTPTLSSSFYCAKDGQVMHLNFKFGGGQTSAATASYSFSLPTAVSASFTGALYGVVFGIIDAVIEPLYVELNGSTATVKRFSGATFPSPSTTSVAGLISYFTD